MAVKVYTPGQFYDAGGVVEEMFYQEVGRTKKYLRKRVGFVRSFKQVIKNLKDEAWRKFHYMKANVRGFISYPFLLYRIHTYIGNNGWGPLLVAETF